MSVFVVGVCMCVFGCVLVVGNAGMMDFVVLFVCFVLNQLFNILLHAAHRAMAAAASRCPSLLLTRKTTVFFLWYTPFLPP